MRKLFAAAAMAAAMASASAASAAISVDGGFDVDAHGTDLGLVVQTAPDSGPLHFDLELGGASQSVNLFTIYTPETAVNPDDKTAYPIDVDFTFTSPAGAGTVSGSTVGEQWVGFLGLFQDGRVTWGGAKTLDLAHGLKLNVALTDTTFNTGFLALHPGVTKGGDVWGTFSLSGTQTGVPEPASWALMIGGFGMAGAMLRRRRGAAATA